jgi:hypothetical protein
MTMTIALESMAVTMPEVAGHPNRAEFRGVLTVVDAASQKAPSGSKGHLVMLTKMAAEAALPSLLGMALDYAPAFDRHDVRRKVGVITRAEIVGRSLELGGHLFAKDFPEIVDEIAKSGRGGSRGGSFNSFRDRLSHGQEIHGIASPGWPGWKKRSWSEAEKWKSSLAGRLGRILSLTSSTNQNAGGSHELRGTIYPAIRGEARGAAGAGLGMSYEVTDVDVADPRARVWTLTKVTFTGAAILRRDKAAYRDTWIELGT